VLFQAESVIHNAVLVQTGGVLGFVHLGKSHQQDISHTLFRFPSVNMHRQLEDLLRLPDRTIAKAIGIHQLRLPRAISIHDPDFSSIGKAV